MSDTDPKKWTKKDIRTLCDQIQSWCTVNRPIPNLLTVRSEYADKVKEILETKRTDIVLAGLRAWRDQLYKSYDRNCQTVGHAVIVPEVWGGEGTPGQLEIIERFKRLGIEDLKAKKKAEELIHRVFDHGLPPEVEAFSPSI